MAREGLFPQSHSGSKAGHNFSHSKLKHLGVHSQQNQPEDLESMEADPKSEKLGEVGVGWGLKVPVSLLGAVGARHTGSNHRGWPGTKSSLSLPIYWPSCGEDVLWWFLGGSFSGRLWLCSVLGVTWKCRHMGNFSPLANPAPTQQEELTLASLPSYTLRSPMQGQTWRPFHT